MKRVMHGLALALLAASTAAAGEIGFLEDFALSKDRAASLRQLIPGTEDYYYYHGLHYLNTEQFDKAETLTKPWLERFGQTPRLTEMQTRYALLTYPRDPQRSLEYLRVRLGLRFDHQKAVPGEELKLPTALDPKLIARETLRASSFARWRNLDNFEDSALDWLAATNLDAERRRHLLQRLRRPDVADLPRLIVEDLRAPRAGDFGSHGIDRQLTLSQLDELLRLRPDLLNHNALVQTWIAKLQPGADEDWRHDPTLTRAFFDRLHGLVSRLATVHNALKAHVLYHRLAFDRAQGVHDKARFLEYLRLPRRQPYMAKAMLEAVESNRYPADLNVNFTSVTLLPIVGNDEVLVRDYLKHFFASADSIKEFEPYVNDVYLTQLFAEVKIVNGLGEPEQWASLLPPELFRQLKERVDIDFAFTNKTTFAADEPVRLDLHIKNVPTLLIKVFEVNTSNYYRQRQREVDTDVPLDLGLVANTELTHTYSEPPLRRVARHFEFPKLNRPGVYVIDFIGSGKSSRALVRKGRLRPLVATTTAGQSITVVDEANRPVKDATVWLGGWEYSPEADGTILVPFSTSPGRTPIVLSRGEFSCLDYIQHQPENFHLAACIHVDREALLAQRIAAVLVRPGLFLNGTPVSIKLLDEVKLRITSTGLDGIATSTEVPSFKLFEDRESIHEFRVPSRLAALSITLQAKVKSLSLNKSIDVAATQTFALNGIDKTDKVEDLHLARFGTDYVLEVLGRTGEAKRDRPVHLGVKHRDFREPVQVTLKTDSRGRIHLGPLVDIASLTVTGPEGTAHSWTLPVDHHTYRQLVHARTGEAIVLPYLGTEAAAGRSELALFEVRGDLIRADRFDALSIRDGMLALRGLAAGDYELWLKRSGERIRVRVVDGPAYRNHVLGKLRHLELPALKPVQIAAVTADDDLVTVRLRDASQFTRLHVFASRYRPAYGAFEDLGRVRDRELSGVFPAHAESTYLTGRNIGDEYRYVLDRKYQKKFPGNMLDRPALLLNPWMVRSTETGEQQILGGDQFRPKGEPAPAAAIPPASKTADKGDAVHVEITANLDFLADASAVLVNLVPDKDGLVKIRRGDIGPHALLHFVAVDPLNTTSRSTALPERPASFLDLRLLSGLDPKGHFTQQKQVSILTPGQPFVLADVAASRFEAYDSLAKVYGLYATLLRDPKLAEFAFVLGWPKLKPEEKRTLYSKHASHELHFFLAKKDPAFFNEVVKPYLANKKDKTFLDRWLLDDQLGEYLQPWHFGRLNSVERILLAQRIAGEPAKTARHLNDLLRLQPPNTDRMLVLFDTAVQSGALGTDDALGVGRVRFKEGLPRLEDLREEDRKLVIGLTPGTPAEKKLTAVRGFNDTDGLQGRAGGVPGIGADQAAKEANAAGRSMLGGLQFQRDGRTTGEALKKEDEFSSQLGDRKDREFFGGRLLKSVEQLYRRLDPTQEYAENNYHHLAIQHQLAGLVPVSSFWLDYARHDGKTPFLSRHLADASRNFSEMLLALAVLDLPFEAGKHDVKFDKTRMTLTPASPIIAFHEEVRPTGGVAGQVPVLVSQNFYREGDRFSEVSGEKSDKFVTGEFVVQTVYGCQVVVTNPTSSRQKLSVLLQVPVGAVPLGNSPFTRTVLFDLEPYRTQTIDYHFYFPRPGQFAHFPVHVAKNETLVAAAAPVALNVVAKPSRLDTDSWDYVAVNGTTEQVLALLGRENVVALDLEKIAFRLRDRGFFESIVKLLQDRHAYHATVWSYGLFHDLAASVREFLQHADAFVTECGGPLVSPLLTIDPVLRYQYEHLEYRPLVNARAHALGKRRQIVNPRIHEHYHHFLNLLGYRQQLTADDLVAVTHYLLLQDRVDEAQVTFAQVKADQVATQVQYDYCSAYLDLFSDEPQRARTLAAKHAAHPVDRWRNAFAVIAHQLDESEGKGTRIADADDRGQRQTQLASREPGFEFNLDGQKINLTWQNVDNARINYYLMDVELLFSRNPFVQQFGGQFALVRPNQTQEVKLPAGQNRLAVALPEDLARRNVLVEVTAGGKTMALPWYANAMDVRLMENYGQLRVTEAAAGKVLPKVYVKVYARLADGQVKFHKDGYTDLRGRFDYSTVSTPERQPISRFAVLVLADERGAVIREAGVPQQ